MQLETLTPLQDFVAVAQGIDLRTLKGPKEKIALLDALYKYGVLIFKAQEMNELEYIEFGNSLGDLKVFLDEAYRHPDYPEIFVVSNMQRNGVRFGMERVGRYWHSDCSFLSEPQPITTLYCQAAPPNGGETAFRDMRAFWQTLPDNYKLILINSMCEHEGQSRYIITDQDVGYSLIEVMDRDRIQTPPVTHPTVFKHPYIDREVLYVNEGFTSRILGISTEESSSILRELFYLIDTSANIYKHRWSRNEVVIWDNRSILHRAFPASHGDRLMFRLGISDGAFFSRSRE